MILHKISTSPFADQTLLQCLKRIQPTDKLLLIQDAVYAMVKGDLVDSLLEQGPIYVLNEDVQARGLIIENNLYQGISYPEFVALTLECKQVISW
ncbi:sulfurtransferase complex subunit TusB [Paraglaciecola sp. MB-3u-78]|jgi:tRNA 2-thiouridine synthesizing protein B|uniref:sulfurtransferase complex subunit TusB n=1 Tax=Paraglaciecola sp. MB-3u-78 TaxID=2058332 RepID=UPI000C32D22B|nr:sulfurtransferase complex subunit TusB [Paraglaciecola sp. MB-3u-78]PKG97409.1 sulfurtransferase complex subunit TusB [Paraglaciecola sp. MB-3u-78]